MFLPHSHNSNIRSYLLFTTISVAIAFMAFYTGQRVAIQQQNEAQTLVALRLAEQELVMQQIADAARRGDADATTELVIVDCTEAERNRFDDLLNALNSPMTAAALQEAELLLNKCGSVSADRRAFMSARLQREVEVFASLHTLRTVLDEEDTDVAERISNWQQLAEFEVQLATHLRELVRLQGEIITLLQAGKRIGTPEISETLVAVQQTQNLISITNQQIDAIRRSLERI